MSTTYHCIHPSHLKLDGGAMFGIIPKTIWSRKIAADELNRIKMTMRVLVIKSETKTILVDTGIGDYHDDKFKKMFEIDGGDSPLLAPLETNQIKAEDVTDIILTHLHFDHVGGLGTYRDGKPLLIFPNANIHLHQNHYEYAQSPNPRDTGSFQHNHYEPLLDEYKKLGQLVLYNNDEGTMLKDGDYELKYKTTSGHTPFQLHPYDSKMFYFGDLIPTSHHIGIPWIMGYDMSPGITANEKEVLLPWLLENGLMVIFNHDVDTWGAKVILDNKKRFAFSEHKNSNDNLWQNLEL